MCVTFMNSVYDINKCHQISHYVLRSEILNMMYTTYCVHTINCVRSISFYMPIHSFFITFFESAIVYSQIFMITSIYEMVPKLPIMVRR